MRNKWKESELPEQYLEPKDHQCLLHRVPIRPLFKTFKRCMVITITA